MHSVCPASRTHSCFICLLCFTVNLSIWPPLLLPHALLGLSSRLFHEQNLAPFLALCVLGSPLLPPGWAPRPSPTLLLLSTLRMVPWIERVMMMTSPSELGKNQTNTSQGPGRWLKQGSQGNSFGLEFCSAEWPHTLTIFRAVITKWKYPISPETETRSH